MISTIWFITGVVFTIACATLVWRGRHPRIPVRSETKCYLVAWIDAGGTVEHVSTCGEPPRSALRDTEPEMLIIFEGRGESYTAAREECRRAYSLLAPRLSKRFPFPGGES